MARQNPVCATFRIHRRNRHKSFNNKTVNLWGQWWKKLMKHLLIWYVLLSSTGTNTHTCTQTNTHTTHAHTRTLKFCINVTHSNWLVCVGVCVCVLSSTCTNTPYIHHSDHTRSLVCVRVCVCGCAHVCVFVCVLLINKYHSKRCSADFFHYCPHN